MALQRYSYEEMILIRMLELSYFQPHYWSELLLLANQLLDPQEREELNEMIFNVEKMVLETEVVPKETDDGKLVWVERIASRLSLYDIEMDLESNPDYYAYFEKDDGTKISKFDIERELNRIKIFLYTKVRQRASQRRFTKFR